MTVPTQPPFYLKHLEKGKWLVDGPFVSEGQYQSHAIRCEWDAKSIRYEVINREEADKLRNLPEQEEVEAKRGPGRPRKETPLSESNEPAG